MEEGLTSINLASCSDSGAAKRAGQRSNVKSAIETHRSICETEEDLLGNSKHRKGKRNSEGHVLSVKFADDVVVQTTDKKTSFVPSSNSSVNVNHEHYEQWARVPAAGKKVTKSTLLRGIQQLKARMKREESNIEVVGLGKRQNSSTGEPHVLAPEEQHYHIKELKRNILLTSDRLTENKPPCIQIHRERVNSSVENVVSRTANHSRDQLKPNSQVIDSGVFKQENDRASTSGEPEVRHSRNSERDSAKLRHGVSRIRDRSAFPISVYQPISIDDRIFLINEPIKDSELISSKKSENKNKKINSQAPSMLFMTDKSQQTSVLNKTPELHVHLDMILRGNTFCDGFPTQNRAFSGSNSFGAPRKGTRGLLPSRIQKRTQFIVSNAELYDFSQLSEIRHSMADKLLERSRTELLFPTQSLRNGYNICNE